MRQVLTGLAPLSLVAQACSFASSIALAHVLGASASTDAYYLGLSIPFAVYTILLAAIRQGAIPSLVEQDNNGEDGALERVGSDLVSAILVASALLTIVVTAIAELVLPLAVGGETGSMSRVVLLELAPLGVLGPLTGALGAILAARGLFALPVLVMAIEPLLKAVLTLAFGHVIGITALIIGNLVGSATAAGLLWWRIGRIRLRVRVRTQFNTPFVRGVVVLTLPLIVSASILQTNPVVDRVMAGDVGAGSVTALELGLRLCFIPTALATSLLIGPLTATWAERKLAGGWAALRPSVAHAIIAIATFVLPLVVVGVVLRSDLVSLVYQGGAYSSHALGQTTSVFGIILLSLPAEVLVVVLVTLFVIEKDTIFPMLIGITNVVLNVVLNFALRPSLGVEGIALSTTLTVSLLGGVYALVAHRRWGIFALDGRVREAVGAIVLTAVIGGVAVVLLDVVPGPTSRLRALVAIVLVAGVAAAILGAALLAHRRYWLSALRPSRSTTRIEA
jgi:putative peptidoglycan lipid II flippase